MVERDAKKKDDYESCSTGDITEQYDKQNKSQFFVLNAESSMNMGESTGLLHDRASYDCSLPQKRSRSN